MLVKELLSLAKLELLVTDGHVLCFFLPAQILITASNGELVEVRIFLNSLGGKKKNI